MPVYKDEERGTWYASFYYTNWMGEKKLKKKRGFKTKREAKDFETQFLAKNSSDPTMSFKSLYELYQDDFESRIRSGTKAGKKNMIETHILPYFENRKINEISEADIRKWQNTMLQKRKKNGEPYSETYLRTLNSQLTAVFNYAVAYHNLERNPCSRVKAIGTKEAGEMEFWTLDEFNKVIACEKRPAFHLYYMVLFWCGVREGEALALTPKKIDHDTKSLDIYETYHRENGQDIFGPPKTKNSVRKVPMPDFVYDEMIEYISSLYGIKDDERIFYFTRANVGKELHRIAEQAGVKRIRVHDLRHSHVSLLIELGYNTHAIADRIGDTPEVVNKVYAHLYPTVAASIATELNRHQNGIQKDITVALNERSQSENKSVE